MAKTPGEWLKQADYDMDTARAMFDAARYLYAVFMCHLSLEKALKGLYLEKLREIPPKTHNLVFLLGRVGIRPAEETGKFLVKLNEASIATRYPEDLEVLGKSFTQSVVGELLSTGEGAFAWIKTQF